MVARDKGSGFSSWREWGLSVRSFMFSVCLGGFPLCAPLSFIRFFFILDCHLCPQMQRLTTESTARHKGLIIHMFYLTKWRYRSFLLLEHISSFPPCFWMFTFSLSVCKIGFLFSVCTTVSSFVLVVGLSICLACF